MRTPDAAGAQVPCEPLFAVHAYRVRRCLAHWLEAGALRLEGPNGDNPEVTPA